MQLGPIEALQAFMDEIAPVAPGYELSTVSFFGVRRDEAIDVLKCVVRLDPLASFVPKPLFTAGPFVAGVFQINPFHAFLTSMIGAPGIRHDAIQTEAGALNFWARAGTSAEFNAFDERGLASYSRFTTLKIRGGGGGRISQPNLDWLLRAHDRPFSDIDDLGQEYGFGALPVDGTTIEVEAHNVGAIDPSSGINGTRATVGVRVASTLFPSLIKVGVKVISDGKPVAREALVGAKTNFAPDEMNPKVLVGQFQMDVPEGALLHCYVSYQGSPLHAYFVHDASIVPNPLRTALETFDPELKQVMSGLAETSSTNRDKNIQDELEHATAALLFMLGFSVFRLGMARMSDAPDLLARAPSGHFLVIECTRGTFPSDKRSKLLKRTAEVRERLRHSWAYGANVLPVIVTSEPNDVARPAIPEAKSEGIVVLTSTDLRRIVADRTLFPQNAADLYEELARSLRPTLNQDA